jgi:hypothetical protein
MVAIRAVWCEGVSDVRPFDTGRYIDDLKCKDLTLGCLSFLGLGHAGWRKELEAVKARAEGPAINQSRRTDASVLDNQSCTFYSNMSIQ